MARTLLTSKEIGEVRREDFNITTTGQAVITKVIAGTNISISSTGVDAGTGDVTINATGGGSASSPLTLTSTTAAEIPLTIVGASGQTANILEIKDNSGNVIVGIKPTIIGGTTDALINIAGTLNSSTTNQYGVYEVITSAGSGTRPQIGHRILLEQGYQGNKSTTALAAYNATSPPSSTAFGIEATCDGGIVGALPANSMPMAIGIYSYAKDAVTQSIGIVGAATGSTSPSTLHIGTAGFALSGTTNVAGYFSLFTEDTRTTVTNNFPAALTSSALTASNGATTSNIFTAYDNITPIFSIVDGGRVLVGTSTDDTTNRLQINGNITVTDEVYGSGWNGSLQVPTKNAVYDKIETLSVGSSSPTVNSYTTSQTLATNTINLFTPSANVTATLPTAVGVAGQKITVKKTDSGTYSITMATTSSQTIDGSVASTVIFNRQMSLDFISDGANWHII